MNLSSIPIGLANLALLQSGDGSSFWMPEQSSTIARGIDDTFYFIYWISVFFFVGIVAFMVIFIIKYRAREGQVRKKAPHHNLLLELVWTGIPLALVVVIFWFTFTAYMGMRTAPAGAYEISVIGQKWQWGFQYPTGRYDSELVIPVDTPIKLNMRSEDVIHSFFIPAFRVKQDVVPGRYATLWFEANKEGEYWALCAEYCGTGHSDMLAKVRVVDMDTFVAYVNEPEALDDRTPAEAGEAMFQRYGCIQCHTVDGSASTGPSLLDAYNTDRPLEGGETVLMDENFIRESLLEPQEKIHAGYQPVMPTFKGKLKDNQIDWLIAYIKTISANSPQSELDAATTLQQEEGEDAAIPDGADGAAEETEAPPQAENDTEQQPDADATGAAGEGAETAEGN